MGVIQLSRPSVTEDKVVVLSESAAMRLPINVIRSCHAKSLAQPPPASADTTMKTSFMTYVNQKERL